MGNQGSGIWKKIIADYEQFWGFRACLGEALEVPERMRAPDDGFVFQKKAEKRVVLGNSKRKKRKQNQHKRDGDQGAEKADPNLLFFENFTSCLDEFFA
jgi:hypothetical protein